MGGKYRQAPKIVETLRPYVDGATVYVEPFCGALGAGSKVVRDLRPAEARFNDLSRELVLLLERCYLEGCEWLPEFVDEDTYRWYQANKPEGDPLTAFIGFGWSFRASWFHGYKRPYHGTARDVTDERTKEGTARKDGNPKRGMERKVRYLREGGSLCRFSSVDYRDMEIPDGAVVYCDPPYDSRTKVGDDRARAGGFDTEGFWQWVRDLSLRCTVVTSCFECPEDFCVAYSWGKNTIVNSQSRGRRDAQRMDGYEKLVMWEGAAVALHGCNTQCNVQCTTPSDHAVAVALHCTSLGTCNAMQHGEGCNTEVRTTPEWGCGGYSECPCGCGWAMCMVFGSFITPADCDGCRYRDDATGKERGRG